MTNTYRPMLRMLKWSLERKRPTRSKDGYAWETIEILGSVVKMCSLYAENLRSFLSQKTFYDSLSRRDRDVKRTRKPYWTIWRTLYKRLGVPRW